MGKLTIISINTSSTHHLQWRNTFLLPSYEKCNHLFSVKKIKLPTLASRGFGAILKSFAGKRTVKKTRRDKKVGKNEIQELNRNSTHVYSGLEDKSTPRNDYISGNDNRVSSIDNMAAKSLVTKPSRRDVLQTCIISSGLMFALGLLIRQVSHFAVTKGWPIYDCSTQVLFDFETWHLELITGLVVLISTARFLLLKTWPDFAESSEAANQLVLSQLEPFDYIIVAFLPAISEELLFRGALTPLFGLNWKSSLIVAAIFGVLHLGNGRRYSFAIWATFVGFAYGYATIISTSIIVPMASHALNNLAGGILWRYISDTSEGQQQQK